MRDWKPKVIAIYLPQFYETEDNNLWWGKGFTDWESVKSARPYFEGHRAPWVPLDGNYYNLNTHETMEQQAKLAKEYGISGFCFYHYYFENGKMELEQPARQLLDWKDIDMPFCFNWASESWIRSWSKIDGNVWSEKYEKHAADSSNGVLVRQDYGREDAWEAHFRYLLPFFKDERYIRIDNKPVFLFYRPDDITPIMEMVAVWRKLALEEGLDGLYLLGVNTNVADLGLDAAVVYEPRTAFNRLNKAGKAFMNAGVRCFEYEEVWDSILEDQAYLGCKTYYTGLTGYDDTPRRGSRGECTVHTKPDVFMKGMRALIEKSAREQNEFVFLNAWNEWGEGMYIEPDEANGFAYLEAVREAVASAECAQAETKNQETAAGTSQELVGLKQELKKYKSFVTLLDRWLEAERYNRIHFTEFFAQNGVKTVAIYGMAMMGKQLYQQLYHEQIQPSYGIDQYVGQYGNGFRILRPEEYFPEVDAIIVTTYDNAQIIQMIKEKSNAAIYLLEDLIDYFWRNV